MDISAKQDLEIGDLLISHGIINKDQLSLAFNQQKRLASAGKRATIPEILFQNGFASRDQMLRAMESSGVAYSGFSRLSLPPSLCRRLGVKIIGYDDGVLRLASLKVLSRRDEEEIISAAKQSGVEIEKIEIQPKDKGELLIDLRAESSVTYESLSKKIEALNNDPDDGMLIQGIVKDLMADAIQSRSSDIHMDRVRDDAGCWISFRIDGDLRYRYLLSPLAMAPLVTRIKGDSGMDISETRLAQDGRFEFTYQRRKIDVRVASLPIDGGETITMRLLDPTSLVPLEDLLSDHSGVLDSLKTAAAVKGKSGAIILVTGPTGSGKTTTLYGIIRGMDRHKLNIMTAEDPVEYRVPFVRQTQVNAPAGQTFASILRSHLRHDPDILIVGELRDEITAETALHSAESGHTVLTTIHAIDALQSIERLRSILSPAYRRIGLFIMANYLRAVVNQRLVKKLCSCCVDAGVEDKRKYAAVMKACGLNGSVTIKKANKSGCEKCDHTGYRGRSLVPECLFFSGSTELKDRLEGIFSGSEHGNLSDVFSLEGVKYISRADSVKNLLVKGLIDLEYALDVLDLRFSQAAE